MAILNPGDEVDRYRVERVIGRGGQATVYQVRHRELGVVRALKVLEAADPTTRARLLAEGRVMAQLRHPNVVEVVDVLRIGESPALLMEFVGGGTLHQVLVERPLSDAEVARYFRAIIDGVGAAHAARVVHRDIKPANVLLDDVSDPPSPKVTDFGIARSDELEPGLTRTHTGLGTPSFMAPEQARNARTVDARADIWSLGALLYVMLTREVPFHGSVWWEVIQAAEQGAYRPVSEVRAGVPEAWEETIRVCLRRNPDERPPDIATLRSVFGGDRWRPKLVAGSSGAGPAVGARVSTAEGLGAADSEGLAGPTGVGLWTDAELGPGWSDGPEPSVPEPVAAPPTPPVPSAPAARDTPITPHSRPPVPTISPPSASSEGGHAPSEPAAPTPRRGDGSIVGVVVDQAGVGHVVEVVVELQPGNGEVTTPMDVARDAAVAAQVAVAAALGPDARRMRVVWQVRGASFQLHGTSLGLAIAIAVRARGRAVPAGWAFAAGVDLDGRLAPVGGLPAKLRAAAEAGCTRVAVAVGAEGPGSIAFGKLEEVEARLFRSPARWLPYALAALPAVAVAVGLNLPLDAAVHYPVLRLAGRGVDITDAVVVALPSTAELRSLRPMYPSLIERLGSSGARAILLDVTLNAESPDDAAIAEAARRSPVPVIIPVHLEGDAVRRPGSAEIASAVQLGHAVSLSDGRMGWIRRAQVRVHDREGRPYWHVAALAANAVGGGSEPSVDERWLTLGGYRNAVSGGSFALAPAGPVPVVEGEDLSMVRGRVAIVGSMRGDRDLRRTADGPRYGAEVLAVEVQTLVRQAAPREVGLVLDVLCTLGVGLATAWLPRGRLLALPLLLVLPVQLASAFGGILWSVVGPLVAWCAVGLVRLRYDRVRRS